MSIRRRMNWLLVLALCWLGVEAGISTAVPARAQQPAAAPQEAAKPAPQAAPQAAGPQASSAPVAVIKQESKLVVADVIVTDKKGNYVHDLEAKDFKISEDNKPQTITTFLTGSNIAPNGPKQRRYLVLFFDNSTMDMSDQQRARQAAMQFIDKTASPDRLMAVVDFGGVLQIAQNFTANTDRLKQVVENAKFAVVSPNEPPETNQLASLGGPVSPMLSAEQDFGVRSVLLALRRLAKNLQTVPGRKTLILFTSGFPVTPDNQPELTATIDACNKANVAIYPLDVRGLVATKVMLSPQLRGASPATRAARDNSSDRERSPNGGASLQLAAYAFPDPQRGGGGGAGQGRGGGGGGGGGRGGGGAPPSGPPAGGGSGGPPAGGGGHGGPPPGGGGHGGPSTPPPGGPRFGVNQPFNQPRQIVPPFPETATPNQEVLYALASGTGGFVILNTNDLLAGLDKIARELDEYYLLGYSPATPSTEGSCHTIQVKVERSGTHVRARSGYCSVRSPDPLLGKPEGTELEARAAGVQSGNVNFFLQAPYFYTSSNRARVNLALQCPAESFHFTREKGKYESTVKVLGIAVREDGSVAARFSDDVKLDLEKDEVKEFNRQPFHYENTFDIAPGKYTLKVAMSMGGETFGKLETPLLIEPNKDKPFTMSAVAISDQVHPLSDMSTSLDAALLDDRTPLVAQGMQIIPSATNQFDHDKKIAFYFEIYDAKLTEANPPRVGLRYTVVDKKTNQLVYDSKTMVVDSLQQKGSPIIPVGMWMQSEKIPPGQYLLQVSAGDNAGNKSPTRFVNFVVR